MSSENQQPDKDFVVKPTTEILPSTTATESSRTQKLERTAESLHQELIAGTRKPHHGILELATVGLSNNTEQKAPQRSYETHLSSFESALSLEITPLHKSQETGTLKVTQTIEATQPTEAVSLQKQVREQLSFLRDHYGVPVYMGRLSERDKRFHGEFFTLTDIEKLILPEAKQALETLTQAMTMYPPEYIEAVGLKGIRLVKSLKEMEEYSFEDILEGKAQEERGTSAGYGLPDGYMYITTNAPGVPVDRIFHHELRHIDDFSLTKNPTTAKRTIFLRLRKLRDKIMGNNSRLQDKQWEKLNAHGKDSYMNMRQFIRKIPDEAIHQETEGFAVNYGRVNRPDGRTLEDKATVAEHLFIEPQRMLKRSETDHVLGAKITEIKRRFHKRSRGKMNDQYFSDLANGSITKDYWSSQDTTIAA